MLFQVSSSANLAVHSSEDLSNTWKYEVEADGGKDESRMTSIEDEDDGPEIVDLQPALAVQANRNVSGSAVARILTLFAKSMGSNPVHDCGKTTIRVVCH